MKKIVSVIISSYLILWIASCKKEKEVPIPQSRGARIVLMNTCSGSSDVTAEIKSTSHTLTHKLNYLSLSGYHILRPDKYRLRFFTFPYPTELAITHETLEYDKHYLAVVVGVVGRARIIVAENDISIPKEGKARVRFINAGEDSCQVNVSANDIAFNDVGYKQTTSYMEVDAGNLNIRVKKDADGSDLSHTTFKLDNQKNYTVLLIGSKENIGKDSLQLQLIKY